LPNEGYPELLPAQNNVLPSVTNPESKQNGKQNGKQIGEQAHGTGTSEEHALDDSGTTEVTEWETLGTTVTPFRTMHVDGHNTTWSVTYNADKVEVAPKKLTLEELFERMQTVADAEEVFKKAKEGLKTARVRSGGTETPSTRRYSDIISKCNAFIAEKEEQERSQLIAQKLKPSSGKGSVS
jgi:hypothetical protein